MQLPTYTPLELDVLAEALARNEVFTGFHLLMHPYNSFPPVHTFPQVFPKFMEDTRLLAAEVIEQQPVPFQFIEKAEGDLRFYGILIGVEGMEIFPVFKDYQLLSKADAIYVFQKAGIGLGINLN